MWNFKGALWISHKISFIEICLIIEKWKFIIFYFYELVSVFQMPKDTPTSVPHPNQAPPQPQPPRHPRRMLMPMIQLSRTFAYAQNCVLTGAQFVTSKQYIFFITFLNRGFINCEGNWFLMQAQPIVYPLQILTTVVNSCRTEFGVIEVFLRGRQGPVYSA